MLEMSLTPSRRPSILFNEEDISSGTENTSGVATLEMPARTPANNWASGLDGGFVLGG